MQFAVDYGYISERGLMKTFINLFVDIELQSPSSLFSVGVNKKASLFNGEHFLCAFREDVCVTRNNVCNTDFISCDVDC